MTTSNLVSNQNRSIDLQFIVAGGLVGSVLPLALLGFEFYYQYLHTPAIHIFFQSKGIFLFWSWSNDLDEMGSKDLSSW